MLLSKMAAEGGGKEMNEIKTQFTTREGLYKLLSHSEYSRPNRVPFNSQGSNPVRVSFVNVNDQSGNGDRLCFNVGRELYFYIYKGVRKVSHLCEIFRFCIKIKIKAKVSMFILRLSYRKPHISRENLSLLLSFNISCCTHAPKNYP
ncbi:WD repeat-containing protein 20 isoform X4 [Notechis scutatus]|uniref:WD repeat-containing protein 20 isoform X4 n=1 Tax=Notechis scutatus TaxID=8663 RepID=A0A6J1UZV0_9SAUR|nr:WD repeat-containing protein 20 isoform X4 [Notechis scutatus]